MCFPLLSQPGPCVSSAALNPPFEMGTWLPFGFPHRLKAALPDSQILSYSPTPLERILKRFGAQTLFFFFFYFALLLLGSPTHPPTPLSLSLSSRSQLKEDLKA